MSLNSTAEYQNAGVGGPGFGGFGGGGIGGFGLVGLIGLLNGRNGLGGGDGDHCQRDLLLMNKLGDLQNEVQGSVSGLKDVTQNQTLFLQNTLAQLALGNQQGFSNLKDAVQVSLSTLQEGLCSVKERVDTEADRTRALINDINRENLNRALSDAKNEVIELRTEGRGRQFARETEINVSQNVNQAQAQQQQQQQLQALSNLITHLANDLQLIKQGQVIFNSGTMAASGTQAAANTRVA